VRTDNVGGAQFAVRESILLFVFRTQHWEACTFMRFDKRLAVDIDAR
jgi:hypothetical protein